jgi:hypothetical protein
MASWWPSALIAIATAIDPSPPRQRVLTTRRHFLTTDAKMHVAVHFRFA